MTHKLFPAEEVRELKDNGAETFTAQRAERAEPDHTPVLKIYNPHGKGVWLLTELAADGDTLFGLIDDGGNAPHIGEVSMTELKERRVVPRTLMRDSRGHLTALVRQERPLERDRFFVTEYPLTVWLEAAQRTGKIVEDEIELALAAHKLKRPDDQPKQRRRGRPPVGERRAPAMEQAIHD